MRNGRLARSIMIMMIVVLLSARNRHTGETHTVRHFVYPVAIGLGFT